MVERISALAEPLRTDLGARQERGGLREWSSQRVAVWANRPWNAEGKQLSLVHYASVEFSAVFTDFAALSWWVTDISERDGVQIDAVEWRLTRETAQAGGGGCRNRGGARRGGACDRLRAGDRALVGDAARGRGPRAARPRRSRQPGADGAHAQGASFAADMGGGPAVEFQPEDIIVSAAVEARFTAR